MTPAPFTAATVSAVVCVALAPRVFALCDRRIARRRLFTDDVGGPHIASMHQASSAGAATLSAMADQCRSAARRIAAGMPAGQALEISAHELATTSGAWMMLARQLTEAVPLEAALHASLQAAHGDDGTCLEMIHASAVERHLSASQLDHVAQVLDDTDALRGEVTVGAAHAMHTARMLTLLPLVVLCIAAMASDALRSSWHRPAVVVPVCLGGILNVAGRVIIGRAVGRTIRLTHDEPDSPSRIADCLAASLSAGLTIDQACARLDDGVPTVHGESFPGVRTKTARSVRHGAPLETALAELQNRPETQPIAEIARAVARDGLAGAHAANQLGAHARSVRRVRTRTAVARLPSSLAVPVTLFYLPAFIIGAVVPVVTTGSPTMRPLAPEWSTHGGGE